MAFLLAELGTSGSLDGQQRLVVKGRFAPKVFEGILRRYVSKFPISFTPVASILMNSSVELRSDWVSLVLLWRCRNMMETHSKCSWTWTSVLVQMRMWCAMDARVLIPSWPKRTVRSFSAVSRCVTLLLVHLCFLWKHIIYLNLSWIILLLTLHGKRILCSQILL